MTLNNIIYKVIKSEAKLQNLVESFWMLENTCNDFIDIVVLPDGRFDIFFSYSLNEPYHVSLMGLGSEPALTSIQPKTILFAISFKLLAVEYLLDTVISNLVNQESRLPSDFFGISKDDLADFDTFCQKASEKIISNLKTEIDIRKLKLFDLIYSSNGAIPVSELSEEVVWSSRQINRYFNKQFGISLKSFCTILRFRASFQHIKNGTTFSRAKLHRPSTFHKRSKTSIRSYSKRIIKKYKRPIYTIFNITKEIILSNKQLILLNMLITNKTIAIIGGGPGGLTLAKLLQLKGANVKVYERDFDKNVRVQGATLDLHEDTGLKALQQAGLMDAFKQNFRPGADKLRIVDQNASIHFDDHNEKKEEDFGSEFFRPEIDRGPLRKILLESLNNDTVIWNSHFDSMQKSNDGWSITFKNGNLIYADIVIGADGANSKIRPFITKIKPIYSGITMIEGTIKESKTNSPKLYELLKGGKIFALGGEKTLIVSSKENDEMSFYTGCKKDEFWFRDCEIDFKNKEQLLNWFKVEFKDWNPIWQELFVSDTTTFIPRPQYYMPLDQSWESQSNITIIGDAAHVMPPFAGEGVNMAMYDALALSESLTNNNYTNTKSAIQGFENQMRMRAVEATKMTLQQTTSLHSVEALKNIMEMFGS